MNPFVFLILLAVGIGAGLIYFCFDIPWFVRYRGKWLAWLKKISKPRTLTEFFKTRPRLSKFIRQSLGIIILTAVVSTGWWYVSTYHPFSAKTPRAVISSGLSVGSTPTTVSEQTTWASKSVFISIGQSTLIVIAVVCGMLLLDIWYKKQKRFDRASVAAWWSWTLKKIQSSLRISAASITWVVIITLFWRLQDRSPDAWKFLWTTNYVLTIATAIILLIVSSLRFFAPSEEDGKDPKKAKRADVVKFSSNVLVWVLIGLWAFYGFEYLRATKKATPSTQEAIRAPVSGSSAQSNRPVLIDQFTITSNEWKVYDMPYGKSRIKVLGPTEAQTFYQDKYRETLRFEGDNYITGSGPTDMLRLRALQPGEEVLVEIYKIQ